jgi:quinoprotein glucose dehydrogenase
MMPFAHLPRHEIDALVEYIFNFDPDQPAAGSTGEKETAYVFAGYNDFLDDRYYPAIKPPWGTLNAIDLASGKRLWQIPLGEYEQLSKEGIPATGTRNYGGPVVTAGGLLIIAASSDQKLRIFDKQNGELLWQYQLPAAGYATPSTYQLDGRQYIVITCSGGKLGTPTGDRYLAFALPAI